MVKIVKNLGYGSLNNLNNLNDPVLNVLSKKLDFQSKQQQSIKSSNGCLQSLSVLKDVVKKKATPFVTLVPVS